MSHKETAAAEEERLKPPKGARGMIQLHPDIKSGNNQTIDIVAVHGLGGDAFSTWTADDRTLWLRDLLPSSELFASARIFTYGYDATAFLHPFAKESTRRTFTFAEGLLNDLADKRTTAAAKRRPIIFLGHSLGGIVIKMALRHAHLLYGQFGTILDSTKAIVFFGTPHQGADAADWATFLGHVGKVLRLRNTEVVAELKRWSNPLVELKTEFAQLARSFQITTFFETQPLYGVVVVPEGSARMDGERARGLDANHISICKFGKGSSNWPIALARLEAIVTEIIEEGTVPQPRPVQNPNMLLTSSEAEDSPGLAQILHSSSSGKSRVEELA